MSEQADNEIILDYWRRRRQHPGLNQAEWTDFYLRTGRLLMRTRLPAEYADPDARQELIHDFFYQKIMQNAHSTQAGDLANMHALHGYLKLFALDQLAIRAALVPLDDNYSGDEDGDAMASCAIELSHDELHLLAEAGIDIEEASSEADRFLARLGEGERLMLRHNFCADADEQMPMDAIAKRWKIASYHYKAKKLGITGAKGGFFQGYEKTLVGGWMQKLRAEITPDWYHELLALLNLLCLRVHKTIQEAA